MGVVYTGFMAFAINGTYEYRQMREIRDTLFASALTSLWCYEVFVADDLSWCVCVQQTFTFALIFKSRALIFHLNIPCVKSLSYSC